MNEETKKKFTALQQSLLERISTELQEEVKLGKIAAASLTNQAVTDEVIKRLSGELEKNTDSLFVYDITRTLLSQYCTHEEYSSLFLTAYKKNALTTTSLAEEMDTFFSSAKQDYPYWKAGVSQYQECVQLYEKDGQQNGTIEPFLQSVAVVLLQLEETKKKIRLPEYQEDISVCVANLKKAYLTLYQKDNPPSLNKCN